MQRVEKATKCILKHLKTVTSLCMGSLIFEYSSQRKSKLSASRRKPLFHSDSFLNIDSAYDCMKIVDSVDWHKKLNRQPTKND